MTGTIATFDEDMPLTMNKGEFLANNTNKQQFINMISGHPQKMNCQTYQASDDGESATGTTTTLCLSVMIYRTGHATIPTSSYMTSSSNLSPGRTQSTNVSATSRLSGSSWIPVYTLTSSSCGQSSSVILHPACMSCPQEIHIQ